MTTPVEGFSPRYEVTSPTAAPRRFGLLSLAAQAAGGAPSTAYKYGVRYWSELCDLSTGTLEGYCPSGDKDIARYEPVPVEGTPFLITSGLVCTAPSFNAGDRASAHLARGEQYRAEQVFWDQQMAREDLIDGGSAPTAACALGKLEAAAADSYIGSPVLHVPVRYLPVLTETRLVQRVGDVLETAWGTRVIVGAGYPGDLNDENLTLLMTGEVGIWRTEIVSTEDFDTRTNERSAVAERLYVLTADCLAATVTVPACPGGAQ